jgi:soluble lytic murein transglycosylase-like protein
MDNRRHGDRRRNDGRLLADDPRPERRRRNRRRRLLQAGLLALAGAAGAKAHLLTRTHLLSNPAQVSVDVTEDDFRVLDDQEYDRADLEALAAEAAEEYGVSPQLVRAVIETESNFRTEAVSPVGAQGPMQLMPTTAKAMGIDDPQDARQNIFGGTKYLSKLLDRFNGNVALALAGYNAGPTVVARPQGDPALRGDPRLRH